MKLVITGYFPPSCYFLKYKIKIVMIKIIRLVIVLQLLLTRSVLIISFNTYPACHLWSKM